MFGAEKTMFRLQATSARLPGFLEKIVYAKKPATKKHATKKPAAIEGR